MTSFEKKVTRRTDRQFMHYKKRLCVTLEGPDYVAFRLERQRKRYEISAHVLFGLVLNYEVEQRRRAKAAEKKAKRRTVKRW